MAEVIDLRSSPLGATQPSSFTHGFGQGSTCVSNKIQDRNSHFSSNEFNSSVFDDPDWFELHSAKRRKPSPSEKENKPPSPLFSQNRRISTPLQEDHLLPTADLRLSAADTKTVAAARFIWEDVDSDPVVFTSPAPETRNLAKDVSQVGQRDEDDPADVESFSFSQPTAPSQIHFSRRTADLLAHVSTRTIHEKEKYGAGAAVSKRALSEGPTLLVPGNNESTRSLLSDDIFDSSPPNAIPTTQFTRVSEAESKAQSQSGAATRALRKRVKEEEKERKRLAKEQKARDKQLAADIAEVNKSKTDKKLATPEMILDISTSLQSTSIGNQIYEYMKQLGAETHFSSIPPQAYTLVQWRRKVSSRYDEDLGHWVPIPERVEKERHILVYLTAQPFVDIATEKKDEGHLASISPNGVRAHITNVRQRHPRCKPIYIIEGLSAWMRKNKNAQNRAYQAAVRGQAQAKGEAQRLPNQQSDPQRKKPHSSAGIDEDLIEDALLELQVEGDCLIHQTTCAADTAFWIKNFTEHISTVPYRQERITNNEAAAFCMDIGQVKTGEDVKDTYIKMLQEVQRVTPAMAYGIASEYPNVRTLINRFKQHGPDMLQDVRKSANKNGAVSDTRLGPKVSRRLYKVFTGLDPASVDGIA